MSAIDVATGTRVWKFDTPSPSAAARRRPRRESGSWAAATATSARSTSRRGRCSGLPDRRPDRRRAPRCTRSTAPNTSRSVSAARRPRRRAARSPHRCRCSRSAAAPPSRGADGHRRCEAGGERARSRRVRLRRSGTAARPRVTAPGGLYVQSWNPNTSNTEDGRGSRQLAGKPVAGAIVNIGGWAAPPTDQTGAFQYPVDITEPGRHVVTVADVGGATIDGKRLSSAQADELLGRATGISVGYTVTDLSAHGQAGGNRRQRPPLLQRQLGRPAHGPSLQLRAAGDGSPTRTAIL